MLEVVRSGFGDVRFGSSAHIEAPSADVRFTPKSGHQRRECDVPEPDMPVKPTCLRAYC